MAEQSIFHNIIRRETAYTQLLCNLLKRREHEKFRNAFLEKIGLSGEVVDPSDIQAEVYLDGHGIADIRIRTKTVCVIVEIKTELGRALEDNQRLYTKKERGYQAYLKEQRTSDSRARLVYLIPAEWKYAADITEEIKAYKEESKSDAIESGDPIMWEEIIGLLQDADAYLSDFRLLLEERFGPVVFTAKEIEIMDEESFPVELFVKLVKFLDDLRSQTKIQLTPKRLDIQKSEIGFRRSFGKNLESEFWVGFWPEFWEKRKKLLCFGVADASGSVRKAFAKSFRKEYPHTDVEDLGGYLMGFVPSKDLLGPGKFEETKRKLMRIWEATSHSDA